MKTTIGVYRTHAAAGEAIVELRAFGIQDSDISYLYINNKGDIKDAQTSEKVSEGIGAGATTGALLGALAGLVVVNGVLPGLGTLFVAGPLAAALGFSGAAATTVGAAVTGAVAGGLIGSLGNFGVDQADAILYEALVRQGDILIIVRSDAKGTKDIFDKTDAREIREYDAK
jgi:hypothetical protein